MIRTQRISFLFILTITLSYRILPINTQDATTKGGSKGGSSFSRFRENISSIQLRRQQQQPLVGQQVINNEEQISKNIISQVVQPVIINQQQESFSKQIDRTETSSYQQEQQSVDAEPAVFGSVQGTAGVDYPTYTSIPNTKFSCEEAPFNPGMYADEFTGCQVYHLCYQGRRESFLCGVGTIFNQAILNCDFWYSVDCSKSSQYYHLNADFGKSSSEPSPGGFSSSLSQTSFEQKSGSFVQPPRVSVQTSNIIDVQRTTNQIYRPIPVQLPQVQAVNSFSSQSRFSSGKVSPPKLLSSFQQSSSSSSSFDGGKTSIPKQWQQQQQQGLLSPGRIRAGSQNQQIVPQFASASSTMEQFATNNSNLIIDNQVPSKPGSKTNFVSQKSNSRLSSGVKGLVQHELEQNPAQPQSDAWRPYFKNSKQSPKVIGSSATTLGPESQQQSSMSTPQDVASTANSIDDVPSPSTSGPANQEPTFSANNDGQSSSSSPSPQSEEVPKVPKSNPPPTELPQPPPEITSTTTTSTTTNVTPSSGDQETAAVSTAIEPDTADALSSTTASAGVESTQPTATSVTDDKMSDTTPSVGVPDEPPPQTTTASSLASPEPTTTTTTTPVAAATAAATTSPVDTNNTTDEAPSSESAADSTASEQDPANESTASRKKKKKKKKREGLANVLTASSVEYANQH